MHPIITAWIEYKRTADIQLSQYDRNFGRWISICNQRYQWLLDLGFMR